MNGTENQIDRAISRGVSRDLATELTAAREAVWTAFANPAVITAYGTYGATVAAAVADRSPAALRPSMIVGMEDRSPDWLWLPRHDASEGLEMVWDDAEATRALEMCRRALDGVQQLLRMGEQTTWPHQGESSPSILSQLNSYSGNNVWEDVIYGLPYDEAATAALGGTEEGRDVVIGGVHYRHEGGEWIALP